MLVALILKMLLFSINYLICYFICILDPANAGDDLEVNARASLSSTPRKSLTTLQSVGEEPSTPEQHLSSALAHSNPAQASILTSSPIKSRDSIAEVLADSAGSDMVDKAAYLQLYDKYLDLQSELEKVTNRQGSLANNANASSSPAAA